MTRCPVVSPIVVMSPAVMFMILLSHRYAYWMATQWNGLGANELGSANTDPCYEEALIAGKHKVTACPGQVRLALIYDSLIQNLLVMCVMVPRGEIGRGVISAGSAVDVSLNVGTQLSRTLPGNDVLRYYTIA